MITTKQVERGKAATTLGAFGLGALVGGVGAAELLLSMRPTG